MIKVVPNIYPNNSQIFQRILENVGVCVGVGLERKRREQDVLDDASNEGLCFQLRVKIILTILARCKNWKMIEVNNLAWIQGSRKEGKAFGNG
ncbi:hypothetical protein Tco_1457992 [Tanacetum coccineum]